MTTSKPGGAGVAAIPADELEARIELLVSNLNPIDHMDCAALLMATCGLRTREALALRWEDVDLEADVLYVRSSCDDLGNPQPAKAPRPVALPAAASEGLHRRRTVQTAYFKRYAKHLVENAAGCASARADSPVVSTPEGKPIRPKGFARWWHDKRCDFGLPGWTLSDLRKARMAVAAASAEAGR